MKNEAHEERLGDAWKDSPADHGVITAPSVSQMNMDRLGFDPDAQPGEGEEKEEAAEEEVSGEELRTPRRRR